MNRLLQRAKLDPTAWYPTQEAKRLRLTELLAQAGAVIESVWVAALILFGQHWRSAAWNLGAAAVFLLLPLLNRQHRFPLLSRLALISAINADLFLLANLHRGQNGTELCFLPMAALPFIIFDTRHRLSTTYGVVLPQVLFIILELTDFGLLPSWLSLASTRWTYWMTVGTAFLMSFLAILAYRRANEKFERELHESQGRFFRMVQSAQEGICVCDERGVIAYVNPALQKLLGQGERDLVGKQARGLLSTACREKFSRFDFPQRTEVELSRPDGAELTAWISTSPLYESGEKGQARIILILDITEARRQERLLEEQRGKMVAAARLSSLGEMAAGMAHEIYNPLTAIRLGLGIIERYLEGRSNDIEKARAASRSLGETIGRIVRIIEGLKEFSQDHRHVRMTEVPVARAVEDTLSLCRERFRSHGVELRAGPINPTLLARAHAGQLSQVLLNLLNNAFQAVDGRPSPLLAVDVRAHREEIELSVTDNGPGIPREIRRRIFEPFLTTKPAGVGTGLGLGISRSIVETHGGRIWFDSRPGRTRFSFTVPRVIRRPLAA